MFKCGLLQFLVISLSFGTIVCGSDLNAECAKNKKRNVVGIVFFPHLAEVKSINNTLQTVYLTQKRGTAKLQSEITVQERITVTDMYVYQNGTTLPAKEDFGPINDAGKVPKIVRGKVTFAMEDVENSYINGFTFFKYMLLNKFSCVSSSVGPGETICEVILTTKTFSVPYKVFLKGDDESVVCLSHGIWKRSGVPSLNLIIAHDDQRFS